jgi:hypothetical protein
VAVVTPPAAVVTTGAVSPARGRTGIFFLEVLYLLGLGAIAWLFFTDRLKLPGSIGSQPTAGVLWFGALGAVLLSLSGVFDHAADWNPTYRLWHIARPLVGAAVGLVAVLIVQAGILTIQDNATPGNDASKFVLYYVIAFLVGYREDTFRALIKRLADVLLAPGS